MKDRGKVVIGALIAGILLCWLAFRYGQHTAIEQAGSELDHQGQSQHSAAGGRTTGRDRLGDEEKAIRSRIQARMASLRDAGVLAPENAPNFLLIGENGHLTNQAITEAGLSAEQAKEVQNAIDLALEKASRYMEETAVYDEVRSNPENGVYHFKLPPFEEAGSQIIDDLKSDLTKIAGPAGTTLINSFNPTLYVQGFGKYEGEVTVTIDRTKEFHEGLSATYSFADPRSGAVIRRGETTHQYFKKYFGSSIEKLVHQE